MWALGIEKRAKYWFLRAVCYFLVLPAAVGLSSRDLPWHLPPSLPPCLPPHCRGTWHLSCRRLLPLMAAVLTAAPPASEPAAELTAAVALAAVSLPP